MNSNSFIKSLTLIHIALCIGLVLFTGVAIFQNNTFKTTFDGDDIFIYVVPLVAMAGYFGSTFIYQRILRKILKEHSLPKKLQQYRAANIVKYALIEGPALLAIVIYFQNQHTLYLAIAICLIAYLFFQKPSLEKLKNEIPLSLDEQKEFDTFSA